LLINRLIFATVGLTIRTVQISTETISVCD